MKVSVERTAELKVSAERFAQRKRKTSD